MRARAHRRPSCEDSNARRMRVVPPVHRTAAMSGTASPVMSCPEAKATQAPGMPLLEDHIWNSIHGGAPEVDIDLATARTTHCVAAAPTTRSEYPSPFISPRANEPAERSPPMRRAGSRQRQCRLIDRLTSAR